MNTKQIQRLIADEKAKITDAELFGSASYRSYLQSIADNISGKYGRGAIVKLVYDPSDTDAAYTDNFLIHINTANSITGGFATKKLKNLCNIGMIGHETGHILFTDFRSAQRYAKYLESGRMFPKKINPKMFSTQEHRDHIREIDDILSEGNPNKLRVLVNIAMHLSNIIEDGYIERLMKIRYPGTVAIGIQLKNLRQAEIVPSVKDMIDKGYDDISIIHNLLLQYALRGNIENQDGASNEYTDFLYNCIPYMDEALSNDSPKGRFMSVNVMLVLCWKYIKPLMDKLDEAEDEETEEKTEENESESASASETPQSKAAEAIINKLTEEAEEASEAPENMNSFSLIDDPENSERNDGEQERMEHLITDVEQMLVDGERTVTRNNDYVTETADHELENVLNDAASERVYSAVEDEILESLNTEIKNMDFGDIHKNVDIIIHRQREFSGREQELYDRAMTELKPEEDCLWAAALTIQLIFVTMAKYLQKGTDRMTR